MVWLKFAICVVAIILAGRYVAKYGDVIAERTGLGGVWIGVFVIAMITSLPELFTGISAVLIVREPDLTIGNLLGANAFNIFNLALLDIYRREDSLLAGVSPAHQLTGWLSLVLVLVVGAGIVTSRWFGPMALGWISWYTPLILLLYIFSIRWVFQRERQQPPPEEPSLGDCPDSSLRVYSVFIIAALFIIAAGIWLATIGDEISLTTGWSKSFVGSLFLAFSTTLPELTVSLHAMRIGATDLAAANLIGSNLFNMTIFPIADLLFNQRPLLSEASPNTLITMGVVVVVTLLFIIGLKTKPRRWRRLSWFNLAVVALFLTGTYLSFTTG